MFCSNYALQCIKLHDALYPKLLTQIPAPPPVLYVLGDVTCLNKPQIAMVGSRNCSLQAKDNAHTFAKQFADLGIFVTSGLAIGIDAASHRGALTAQSGGTIAVLAHGMDMIYPKQHTNLAEEILQQGGCLVSEFPIGAIPLPGNFPQRNRIISGLSLGVLVVEADLKSGSLITARHAVDQNREVFAIPGSIQNPRTRGCHRLIQDGAKLAGSVDDVLEDLESLLQRVFHDKYAHTGTVRQPRHDLTAQQQQLLDFIDYDSTCVDTIINHTGLTSSAVGAVILELELHGVITAVPGGYARTLD